jgi:maleate cis-trans isomerase
MSRLPPDVEKTARGRLLKLLSDLQWHTRHELEAVSGNRYSARLLELKRLGYTIRKRPLVAGLGNEYKLESLDPATPKGKKVKVFLSPTAVMEILKILDLYTIPVIPNQDREELKRALRSYENNKEKL